MSHPYRLKSNGMMAIYDMIRYNVRGDSKWLKRRRAFSTYIYAHNSRTLTRWTKREVKNRNLREYDNRFRRCQSIFREQRFEREIFIYIYVRSIYSTLIVTRVCVAPFQIIVSDKSWSHNREVETDISLHRNVIIAQKEATKLSASPSSMIRGYLMSSVNSFPKTHILGCELTDFH